MGTIGHEREPIEPVINHVDAQYSALLLDILQNGVDIKGERTGTGTRQVFGRFLKIDLSKEFPLLTTKKVWFKGIKEELLWFIKGERNIRNLVLKDVNIWNEWPFQRYLVKNNLSNLFEKNSPQWEAKMEEFINRIRTDSEFAEVWGDLGPVYGYQWRHWKKRDGGGEIDQLANQINTIKNDSLNRRILVTAWNPEDVQDVALPPCHWGFQFEVEGDKLNTFMVQRSVDTFLGLPFNIASYALLTALVAKVTGKIPGELNMALGATHIYLNHMEQVKLQLSRQPRELPRLILDPNITDIDNISSDQIRIEGYHPHPAINAPISV